MCTAHCGRLGNSSPGLTQASTSDGIPCRHLRTSKRALSPCPCIAWGQASAKNILADAAAAWCSETWGHQGSDMRAVHSDTQGSGTCPSLRGAADGIAGLLHGAEQATFSDAQKAGTAGAPGLQVLQVSPAVPCCNMSPPCRTPLGSPVQRAAGCTQAVLL